MSFRFDANQSAQLHKTSQMLEISELETRDSTVKSGKHKGTDQPAWMPSRFVPLFFTYGKKQVFSHLLAFEPREKTGLRGFRPGPTLTGLYYYRRWLET